MKAFKNVKSLMFADFTMNQTTSSVWSHLHYDLLSTVNLFTFIQANVNLLCPCCRVPDPPPIPQVPAHPSPALPTVAQVLLAWVKPLREPTALAHPPRPAHRRITVRSRPPSPSHGVEMLEQRPAVADGHRADWLSRRRRLARVRGRLRRVCFFCSLLVSPRDHTGIQGVQKRVEGVCQLD